MRNEKKNKEAMDSGVLVPNLLSKESIFQIENPQGYRKGDVQWRIFSKGIGPYETPLVPLELRPQVVKGVKSSRDEMTK